MHRMDYQRSLVCAAVVAVFLLTGLWAQKSVVGEWEGVAVSSEGEEIPFSMVFKSEESELAATITIPSRGVTDLELEEVKQEGSTVSWVLSTPDGAIYCKAELKEEGKLSGVYQTPYEEGPFTLERK